MFRRRRHPPIQRPRLVRVAVAMHQPEAEMLAGLLEEFDIPVMIRRTTFDVPDMLAAGPRELLVPEDRAAEARALLEPEPGEPEPA